MNDRPVAPPPPGRPLADVLRAAARELDAQQPPPAVWAAVRAAQAQHLGAALLPVGVAAPATRAVAAPRPPAAARPRWRTGWAAWSGAAACATLLVASTLLMLVATPVAEDSAGASATGFVPLVPTERWSGADAGPTWLVSAELPRERLAALGLPYDPARAGESVRAELLLHASGEVLAVRFLR